jgi:hypothetical protein
MINNDTFVIALITACITGFVGFAGALLGLFAPSITAWAELKKRKPETITHYCRVAQFDVYTFTKPNNKQTPPVCLYLDSSDLMTCHINPNSIPDNYKGRYIEGNTDFRKCYIALYAEKVNLKN